VRIARVLIACGVFALALGVGATIAGGQAVSPSGGLPAPGATTTTGPFNGGTPAVEDPTSGPAHASQTPPGQTNPEYQETTTTTTPTTPTATTPTETTAPTQTDEGGQEPGGAESTPGGSVLAHTGLSIGLVALAGFLLLTSGALLRRRTDER
jgi:hypothetical protein